MAILIGLLSSVLIASAIIIWSRTLPPFWQRTIALILFVLGCIAVALQIKGTTP